MDDAEDPRGESALVVDELPLVRAGIAAELDARGIEVVGQTRSGREAVSLATVDPVSLVVCGVPADLPIPDLIRRLVKVPARPVIVALLPPAHDDLVAYLVALGVQGIALRAGDTEEFGVAVDAALKGVQFVVPGLHAALSGQVKLRPLADSGPEVLSSREREVLVLLAEGRTNREIAAALSVTLATVKSHLVKIYAKLEASNRNEALGRAVSLGLLG